MLAAGADPCCVKNPAGAQVERVTLPEFAPFRLWSRSPKGPVSVMPAGSEVASRSGRGAIFTLDLEDHTQSYAKDGRYRDNAYRILEFLEELGVRGTIFAVGRVSEANPQLIRAFAERGHELACHSYCHTPLDRQTPRTFREETYRAKDVIEQCAGVVVKGYRAPSFSLTADTVWSVEILRELGLVYSSSVMPAPNPLYGFPHAPKRPFRWPNGLIELPVPVAAIGPIHVPFLGGIYLRYMPSAVVRWLMSRAETEAVLWTYVHPHDFDPEEPYTRIPGASTWTSALLWMNRRNTYSKIAQIVDRTDRRRFEDLLATPAFGDSLPVFESSAARSGSAT